jgi:hypothetical protein
MNLTQETPVRCKHCRAIILAKHCRAHALDCHAKKRKQKLDRVTLEKNGMRLYAVVAAHYAGKGLWKQEIHYLHAENVAHARGQFCHAYPNRKRVKIMEVGLAIGWEVNEKTGAIISS